jgi:Flp pilus assembly protein TadB
VSQDPAESRRPAQYVAAGALYLVLSGVLYLLWLTVEWYVVLFLSLPTCVAGLVLISVGWPRWRRERARRTAQRTAQRTADHRHAVAPPPAGMRRS